MRWPVVLFDLDGTLTDPRLGITRGVQVALAELGIVVDDPDSLTDYIGPPIQDGLQLLHGVDEADVERGVDAYRAYYRRRGMFENELHPGIDRLLGRLADEGAVLGVATS